MVDVITVSLRMNLNSGAAAAAVPDDALPDCGGGGGETVLRS